MRLLRQRPRYRRWTLACDRGAIPLSCAAQDVEQLSSSDSTKLRPKRLIYIPRFNRFIGTTPAIIGVGTTVVCCVGRPGNFCDWISVIGSRTRNVAGHQSHQDFRPGSRIINSSNRLALTGAYPCNALSESESLHSSRPMADYGAPSRLRHDGAPAMLPRRMRQARSLSPRTRHRRRFRCN